MIDAIRAPNVTSVFPTWSPKNSWPVPFANIGPRVAPLQHDKRYRKNQHHEFQEQAYGKRELIATRAFQSGGLLEPATQGSVVVAQPLYKAVDPEQQQIYQAEDRSRDD